MKKILLLSFVAALGLSACQKDTPDTELDSMLESTLLAAANGQGLTFFTMPESNDFSAIPQDPKNPITQKKVELGKLLFHETGIGLNPVKAIGTATYSCASCHFAAAGFQAGRFQGIGEGGIGIGARGATRTVGPLYNETDIDVQPVRSPSAMNLAYQTNILWNGQFGATGVNTGLDHAFTPGTPKEVNTLGYEGLETQAIAGVNVHRLIINDAVVDTLGYKTLFDEAFAHIPEDERYTTKYAGLAIAAYERILLSNQAPFQKWLKGKRSAMTLQEKRGVIVFFEKGQCGECHTGPALSSMAFYALGMKDLYDCPEEVFKTNPTQADHLGRGGFTGDAADNYKFKVPQLYNLKDSPFYGHGASLRTIREVIEYKNAAVRENPNVPSSQLAASFQPLGLTNDEIEDLTAFLNHALYDPDLSRYEPESVLSGNCVPNNDPMSRRDLGCN